MNEEVERLQQVLDRLELVVLGDDSEMAIWVFSCRKGHISRIKSINGLNRSRLAACVGGSLAGKIGDGPSEISLREVRNAIALEASRRRLQTIPEAVQPEAKETTDEKEERAYRRGCHQTAYVIDQAAAELPEEVLRPFLAAMAKYLEKIRRANNDCRFLLDGAVKAVLDEIK